MNQTDLLRNKLRSANKLKLKNERNVLKLRLTQRTLLEDLTTTTSEIEHYNEVLEDLKAQLIQAKNQNSIIEICKSSEEAKIASQLSNLKKHRQCFNELFSRESNLCELRNQEIREREVAEAELARQKLEEVARRDEELAREAAAIDAEACAIEKECAVLKKRNNAIMLKLRKKLIETENNRRELMKNKLNDNVS